MRCNLDFYLWILSVACGSLRILQKADAFLLSEGCFWKTQRRLWHPHFLSKNNLGTSSGDDKEMKNETIATGQDSRPFLAVLTETNSCDSSEQFDQALRGVRKAIGSGQVDLVIIRVFSSVSNLRKEESGENTLKAAFHNRLENLIRTCVQLADDNNKRMDPLGSSRQQSDRRHSQLLHTPSRSTTVLVASHHWREGIHAGAHGFHVPERDRSTIPSLIQAYKDHQESLPEDQQDDQVPIVWSTSAHSMVSAMEAFDLRCDYLLVGTCYMTTSHPEKAVQDLEGPALPGQIVRAFESKLNSKDEENDCFANGGLWTRPMVLAIGGIDVNTCREPVVDYGADGVAVIRAVLQADDPATTITEMHQKMHHYQLS